MKVECANKECINNLNGICNKKSIKIVENVTCDDYEENWMIYASVSN